MTMDVQKIEVSLEDLKSRIPALFPYIEWNEDGTLETHLATDSSNGCYGKVVDNMKTPVGVRLTNYVQIQEIEVPEQYQWDNSNTIGISEDLMAYFSVSGASFLRKVVWYFYSPVDEIIQGAEVLEKLPELITDDSLEEITVPKIGLDGSVIECDGNTFYQSYVKKGRYSFFKREDIIKPCTTYSYRTIINEYYKYKDIVGEGNEFIKFVERGIGLLKVDRQLLNLEDIEKYPEVPEYVYLSQVKRLKTEYDELRNAYNHYQTFYLANGKTSKALSDKAERYVRIGGDNMRNWLGQMVQKAYDIADYYKCRADNKDFPVRINTNIFLCNHTNVTGLTTVFENVFSPGNRYYDGDLLTYDGRTYICKLDRLVSGGDNNYQYIKKTVLVDGVYVKALLVLCGESYEIVSNSSITYLPTYMEIPSECVTSFIVQDGQYYRFDEDTASYKPIDVREYSTGMWDNESERYVFDAQHFVLLSELENYDEWYDSHNLDGDSLRYFVDLDYIPTYHMYDYIRFNGNIFAWDDDTEDYVPTDGTENSVYETTNSKLATLRIPNDFINEFGTAELPGDDEDWLYFYKIGYISGKVVETDEIGNIVNDGEFLENEICYGLHAYGNLITSISYDSAQNTVTFKYVIGGHLVAKAAYADTSIFDNTVTYYYTDFMYDEELGDGVKFTETYKCKGESIRSLGADFENYVKNVEDVVDEHMGEKFPFDKIPVISVDGSVYSVGNAVSLFEAHTEMTHSVTVPEDWMFGLYYQPKVLADVSIDRGNGASFDRHIRLGEIHTMDDMVNYQNGGYFRFSQN